MEITIILFKTFLVANLITSFAPIQWILEIIPKNILTYILILLTSCMRCCMTWVALIMTGDIFIAAGAALFGEIITKIKEKIWQRNNPIL